MNQTSLNLKKHPSLKNQKGQGLIEYLIIISIMGVASIAVINLISGNLRAQFSNVANALGTNQTRKVESKTASDVHYRSKDLSNFFQGSVDGANK
ncbi:MAG: hypothetical protein ACLGGX_01655 [Bdellovibrionia bacterium]